MKVYEYEPTFMHAKYGVVDGQWSIIGSPNLNFRSRELDEENAMGIRRSARREAERHFVQDLGKSKQISLDEWRQAPLQKLFETISRILDQQS